MSEQFKQTTSVGIIGVGSMGGNAAERLNELGFPVIGYDAQPDKLSAFPFMIGAASIADLAKCCDVILAFLPYSHQVVQVSVGDGGVVHSARPGSVFVNMSTISPKVVQEIGEVLEGRGLHAVGAPMNGGPDVLREGKLALVVGGRPDAIDKCRHVLDGLGTVKVVGELGAGEVVKIVNNLILAVCINANAEALVLGARFGVPPDVLVDSVIEGVGSNHAMRRHYKNFVLPRDFGGANVFSVNYMRKDLALALELANDLRVPLEFGALADQRYQAARAKGYEEKYHAIVCTVIEDICGVQIAGPKA